MKLFISFFTFLLATTAFSQEIEVNSLTEKNTITQIIKTNSIEEPVIIVFDSELALNGFPLPTTKNTIVNKRHQFRYILNRYC